MNDRRPLIAGNWKMFKSCGESAKAAQTLAQLTQDVTHTDILICPTFTALSSVWKELRNSKVSLGAQNVFWEKEGAFTGEISAPMLASVGCKYVIIGHSERRQFFGETDETVNKKIAAVIRTGLIPILCVGETENERESNQTFSVLDKQVKNGLKEFISNELTTLVIAYEPVWAIGTGKTATKDQAQEAHEYIRSLLKKIYGETFANTIRILYGGSVKPGNIVELMAMPDIDGALVGGASLNPEIFSEIVHFKN